MQLVKQNLFSVTLVIFHIYMCTKSRKGICPFSLNCLLMLEQNLSTTKTLHFYEWYVKPHQSAGACRSAPLFWSLICGYTMVSSPRTQTQNKAQWLAACGHVSASSQSLRFILSLRMNLSFITSRPGSELIIYENSEEQGSQYRAP